MFVSRFVSRVYSFLFIFRQSETPKEIRERLDKDMERYHNLNPDAREDKLAKKREYIQNDRAKESNLRRSTRLEADRANKRIQQALKSTKDREKDAHTKWKQRYKK